VDDVDRPARRRLVGGRHGEDLADDVFPAVGVGQAPGVERTAAYRPVLADLGDPDPRPEQFPPAKGTPLGLCPEVAGWRHHAVHFDQVKPEAGNPLQESHNG
jgi:hypothetical protein